MEHARMMYAARTGLVVLLSAALGLCFFGVRLASPDAAFAATDDIEAEADAAQQKVEETAAAYDDAVARVQELDEQIQQNEQRIDQIEQELPEQQERCASAVKAMYTFQQQSHALLDMILGTSDLATFLTTYDYIDHIQARNVAEIDKLSSMQNELETTRGNLSAAKMEADDAVQKASDALAQAQAAREEAQRKAEEQAAREAAALQAELEAAAQREAAEAAAKAAEETAKKADDAGENAEKKNDDSSQEAAESSSGGSQEPTVATADNADWSADKTAFVNEWAPRIDAYLAGSPLAGQGETFAVAAWNYGVDPRWSPAISNTESSKGRYCFASHNAWGWGSSSWGSWEEAIDAHVRGLARGYGYTISKEAAKKYCPPNWEHWYSATSAQMNLI